MHGPDQQKQNTVTKVSQLRPLMCILLLHRGRFMYFGLVESLINILFILTQHRVIELARQDENGMLPCAMIS